MRPPSHERHMLLIDRLRRTDYTLVAKTWYTNPRRRLDSFLADLANCVAIDASNVYDYAHAIGEISQDDVPNATPPFPYTWIEGRTFSKWRGTLFEAHRGAVWPPSAPNELPANPDAAWSVCATTVSWERETNSVARLGKVWYQVLKDGSPARRPDGPVAGARIAIEGMPQHVGEGLFLCAGLALSFIHCRNVRMEERGPSRQERRQSERDATRPFFRYHILQIDAIKRILESEGGISQNGARKALHICRGHFKNYTEAAPLFGRVTGQFFWESHYRGDARIGVVGKDYKAPSP